MTEQIYTDKEILADAVPVPYVCPFCFQIMVSKKYFL